jgi:hypothetical protein
MVGSSPGPVKPKTMKLPFAPNKIPKVNTIKIRLPKVNGICTIFIHQVIYLQIITVQNTEELILILHTICDFDS